MSMTGGAGFELGDHLRVRRSAGYFHHGIYISHERVIQFGGRIADKPGATIEAVSLKVFADGESAEVVRHGRKERFGLFLPSALPREEVVKRAEWLVGHH